MSGLLICEPEPYNPTLGSAVFILDGLFCGGMGERATKGFDDARRWPQSESHQWRSASCTLCVCGQTQCLTFEESEVSRRSEHR